MAKFCMNCGSPLQEGARFCPECGTRIQPAPAVQPSVQPAPQPSAPERQRTGKGRVILCLVLCVVMILELLVIAFRYPGLLVKKPETPAASAPGLHTQTEAPAEAPTTAPTEAPTSQTGTVTQDNSTITLCGVTVDVAPMLLKDGAQEVSVSVLEETTNELGEPCRRFDLSMGEHRTFEVPVLVTFPYEAGAGEDVYIRHFDEETQEWVPMLSFMDRENHTVSAYFSSFSPAEQGYSSSNQIYYVDTDSDNPWMEKIKVSSNYWNVLQKVDPATYENAVEKFIGNPSGPVVPMPELDPNMDAKLFNEAFSNSNTLWGYVADPLISMGLEALPYASKNKAVSFLIDHGGTLSTAMSAVPFATMAIQTGYDLLYSDKETTGQNVYKNLVGNTGSIYSLVTGYSNIGFSVTMLGVGLFGMELDYLVNEAKAAQAENVADVYKAYYETSRPFDANHWYEVFCNAYWKHQGDAQKAMGALRDAVDEYVNYFWTDVYGTTSDELIFTLVDAGYKKVFTNATAEQKAALSEQQKARVWKLIREKSMKYIYQFLAERMRESVYSELACAMDPYNRRLEFQVQETVNLESTDVAKYKGCVLCIGLEGKPVPGWEVTIPEGEETDDGWSTSVECTVYSYLKLGSPQQLLIYKTEADKQGGKAPMEVHEFPDILKDGVAFLELGKTEEPGFEAQGFEMEIENYPFVLFVETQKAAPAQLFVDDKGQFTFTAPAQSAPLSGELLSSTDEAIAFTVSGQLPVDFTESVTVRDLKFSPDTIIRTVTVNSEGFYSNATTTIPIHKDASKMTFRLYRDSSGTWVLRVQVDMVVDWNLSDVVNGEQTNTNLSNVPISLTANHVFPSEEAAMNFLPH